MIIWIGFSQAFGINKRTRIGEHFISQVRLGKQHTTYNDSEFYLQDVKKIDKRNRNLKKKIANAPTDNFHVVEWLLRIENGNGSHMGNFVSNGSTVSTWDTPCLAAVTFQEFIAQHQLFILGKIGHLESLTQKRIKNFEWLVLSMCHNGISLSISLSSFATLLRFFPDTLGVFSSNSALNISCYMICMEDPISMLRFCLSQKCLFRLLEIFATFIPSHSILSSGIVKIERLLTIN